MAGVRCDVRDDEPDEDGAAVEVFPGVELAAAVLELADRRWRHRAAAAVREVEAPLAGLGVVEAEAQAFDAARGALHVELHEIRRAAPDLPNHGRSLVFDPGGRAGERLLEPAKVRLPRAGLEVEVVPAIAPFRSGRDRVWGSRGRSAMKSDQQAAKDARGPAGHEASRLTGGASDSHGAFRKSVIQLISHVFPASGEKACSQCADVGVMPDQTKRTLMGFPRSVSSA